MRASSLLAVVAFSSVAVLVGCSSSDASPGSTAYADPPMSVSSQLRDTAPVVAPADATALVDGNAAFADDLYEELAADPASSGKNLFFSPHSISIALAMTYAGARGNTATQMASTLHYTLPQDRLHPAFDQLDLALASRGQGASGDDGKPFKLSVTNSVWGAPQTTFAGPFLDTLARSYGSGVRLTDFAADPSKARSTINTWVDHETDDRIKELLPDGAITVDTRMVLVNAIYFNAEWATPFEASATTPGAFHGLGGDTTAQLMGQSGEMPYAKGDGWQAVSLPYNGNLSFVAVMPDSFASFETTFTATQAKSIGDALAYKTVALTLPKFKIEGASISLKNALLARGMKDAFDPGAADFSGISSAEKLWIGDVIHQAFVSVDEDGTEAAAATAVVAVGGAAAPVNDVTLRLDHPFVFFIKDNATGAVLFQGRVVTL